MTVIDLMFRMEQLRFMITVVILFTPLEVKVNNRIQIILQSSHRTMLLKIHGKSTVHSITYSLLVREKAREVDDFCDQRTSVCEVCNLFLSIALVKLKGDICVSERERERERERETLYNKNNVLCSETK